MKTTLDEKLREKAESKYPCPTFVSSTCRHDNYYCKERERLWLLQALREAAALGAREQRAYQHYRNYGVWPDERTSLPPLVTDPAPEGEEGGGR